MKKRIIGLMLCLLIISTIGYTPHVSALSCAGLNIESLMDFDGVIVATVTSFEDKGTFAEVEVDVLESYKGITTTSLSLVEFFVWGSYSLTPGQTYILALGDLNDQWITGTCLTLNASSEYYAPLHAELAAYPTLELKEPREEVAESRALSYIGAGVTLLLIIISGVIIYYYQRRHKNIN